MNRLTQSLFNKRPVFVYLFQSTLVFVSLVFGWFLRFNFSLPYRHILLVSGLLLVGVRLVFLRLFKLDHGWWHFASVNDVQNILKAVFSGSVLFFALNRYVFAVVAFPRSIYFLEAILTAGFLAGARLASRILAETARRDSSPLKRVVLVGAGFAAQMVIRELARPDSGYRPVGCVDDDPSKQGVRIQGVPVFGAVEDLVSVVEENSVDEILITIPSASGKQMQRIINACQKTKLPFKTVPALRDIIRGEAIVSQVREVQLEDLLGREPVHIDLDAVRREISGRSVLITGAAGSIGSELCRQVVDCNPSQLLCLDQSETGLFFLQLELMPQTNDTGLTFCVADINDAVRMQSILRESRPEIIFHAAAYKHVPMMETNVQEAVKNNVLALVGLLDLADEAGCKNFVLISSDKAVNPTNVMGATKRICELILSSRPQNGMRCVSVRFGNVLGSSGSVITVLKQQLRNGQPLTVTHPEIRRFFMITREAVALVLQAFAIGVHRDILVLDMGEPIRILDLALNLIRLCGKSEQDVEVQFTGLRKGEKLEEELFYHHEEVLPTSCAKIKRTNGSPRNWSALCYQLDELRASMSIDGAAPIRAKIKQIVPEYSHQPSHSAEGATGTETHRHLQVVGEHD
ncbi:MAG TPA: nucleoside-diphosphate sugar epimerase/dehydratase [Candidatus Acidoferrales bacterium]|nr:nucleoside-diphosphate sugar epimerase/dehydratase [Candidatus Acidoferrales bacterium]